ncbi:DoxX family protein [Pedobacter sp. SYP-B3415]|uniref:DoxX family protein n=1 Tax=Pedobacter sp. SYP-B3415 TaxID=2496641 RepID=UPI00101C4B3B|nr:DoxX family protein [Pedobacter sp. SYP-B3415]
MRKKSATTLNSSATGRTALAGKILLVLCILFLLFDAVGKIMLEPHSVKGTLALGWPAYTVRPVGIVLLLATIVYSIPRTRIPGAILVTAFLGGATATMVRVGEPFYFAVVFGMLVWTAVILLNPVLKNVLLGLKNKRSIL